MNDNSIKDRVVLFLKYSGIGQKTFENSVGISNGYVNNIGKSIGSRILNKITKKYPELNTSWLLTGEGSMIKPIKNTPFEYQKHEYEVITFDSFDQGFQQDYINEKARHGWELVSVVQFTDKPDSVPCFRFYFKRETE